MQEVTQFEWSPDKPFMMYTDCRDNASGVVLQQNGANNLWPIAYYLRILMPGPKYQVARENEIYAVVSQLRKFLD